MNLTVYNYQDPGAYIHDIWVWKKSKNPKFSLRSLALQLGLKSHSSLYQIIQHDRPVPKSYVPKLKKIVGLDKDECAYLEAIVDLSRAKTLQEKAYFLERVKQLNPKKEFNFTEVNNFKFLSNPLNAAVLELATTKNFKNDLKWIQQKLSIKATLSDIKASINLLLELGFLKSAQGNKLIRYEANIKSQQDVTNRALQEYHIDLAKIVIDQIAKQDVSQREFNGYIFNFDSKNINKAKTKIRNFIREFSEEFEASPGDADDVFCMQSNLFSLTKIKDIN